MTDIRDDIKEAIAATAKGQLRAKATKLFKTLGYASDRTLDLGDSSPEAFLEFIDTHAADSNFNRDKALADEWKSADLLFQLTDEDISSQRSLFENTDINATLMRSYVFFAIELTGKNYARGKLTDIARQINRAFPMPVMVLLKHKRDKQQVLSIAVINRRRSKRDASKDVLGKVTIIRDISIADPHRGHLDILGSFAFPNLQHPQRLPIDSFDALHTAWEEIFNVDLLNKKFYKELANWYFWALPQVEFPDDAEKDDEKRRATSLIRLLTRLIFCWFLKEKGLIPEKLFHESDLNGILKEIKPESSSYHQGILQNLFFGTLNQRMGKDKKTKAPYRKFALDEGFKKNRSTYGVDNLFRYEEHFINPDSAIDHFADIPFLNGGLFECLDRTDKKTKKKIYIDGFSRNKKKRPSVPNHLFFSDEVSGVDLSDSYGERTRRNESVRGLLRILNSYKFTIVENTPIDQEIALDPELLGKVFENLLASYNEETKTTARKQTGSFYTPRPIVEYMVNQSLKAHLKTALTKTEAKESDFDDGLERLFAYTEEPHGFSNRDVDTLLEAIHTCKILDPACGSGAFPMGILQKLVHIIHRLDPDNKKWKQLQINRACEHIPDVSARNAAIEAIEKDFRENDDDYGRKLYLIQNCLYGVDIQPIAIQISKLRFFISLVCDQSTNRRKAENHGIRPLPNLETKFVAADTLISLRKNERQMEFQDSKAIRLESELQAVRHEHFAVTTRRKKLALQDRDRAIRDELAAELVQGALWDQTAARKLADWDPYDPESVADYFEPLWMFDKSLSEGFDVVIGNPPYVQIQKFNAAKKDLWQSQAFDTYAATADIYCLFYEKGADLLRDGGVLCYITSNKWMRAAYGKKLRKFLSESVDTQTVLDFGMAQNFGAATTYTCILKIVKQPSQNRTRSCYVTDDQTAMADPGRYSRENSVEQFHLNEQAWVVISKARQKVKTLIEALGTPLKQWDIEINYGIKTGFNEAFYITEEQRSQILSDEPSAEKIIVPLVRGRHIARYEIDWDQGWMINSHNGLPAEAVDPIDLRRNFPKVWKHVSAYEKQLENRSDKGEHWSNLRSCAYLREFNKPKVIYQEIATTLPFYFDECENYFLDTTAFMLSSSTESLGALSAFLNSSLFRCCFRDNFPEYSGNAYRVKKTFMQQIPIMRFSASTCQLLAELVRIVQASKKLKHKSAYFFEDLIDALVMEQYFPEHMAERDLLFGEKVQQCLDHQSNEQSAQKLDTLFGTMNASHSPIRNGLLRLTAESPDLLAVIKAEGQV